MQGDFSLFGFSFFLKMRLLTAQCENAHRNNAHAAADYTAKKKCQHFESSLPLFTLKFKFEIHIFPTRIIKQNRRVIGLAALFGVAAF